MEPNARFDGQTAENRVNFGCERNPIIDMKGPEGESTSCHIAASRPRTGAQTAPPSPPRTHVTLQYVQLLSGLAFRRDHRCDHPGSGRAPQTTWPDRSRQRPRNPPPLHRKRQPGRHSGVRRRRILVRLGTGATRNRQTNASLRLGSGPGTRGAISVQASSNFRRCHRHAGSVTTSGNRAALRSCRPCVRLSLCAGLPTALPGAGRGSGAGRPHPGGRHAGANAGQYGLPHRHGRSRSPDLADTTVCAQSNVSASPQVHAAAVPLRQTSPRVAGCARMGSRTILRRTGCLEPRPGVGSDGVPADQLHRALQCAAQSGDFPTHDSGDRAQPGQRCNTANLGNAERTRDGYRAVRFIGRWMAARSFRSSIRIWWPRPWPKS